MVKAKYQGVLDLGQELNIQNGDIKEENGVLHVSGTAANQYEKNQIWDGFFCNVSMVKFNKESTNPYSP